MTYVAYGPLGPRLALAVSADLREWRRLGSGAVRLPARPRHRPEHVPQQGRGVLPRAGSGPARPAGLRDAAPADVGPRLVPRGRDRAPSGRRHRRAARHLDLLRAGRRGARRRPGAGPAPRPPLRRAVRASVRGAEDRRRAAAAAGRRGLAAHPPRRHRRAAGRLRPDHPAGRVRRRRDAARPGRPVAGAGPHGRADPCARRPTTSAPAPFPTSSSRPRSRRSTASGSCSTAWPTPRSAWRGSTTRDARPSASGSSEPAASPASWPAPWPTSRPRGPCGGRPRPGPGRRAWRTSTAPRRAPTGATLLTDDGVDVVAVVAPPDRHAEITLAALDAGRHVLCEKPLATDLGSRTDRRGAAEASDRVLVVDHVLRYNPLLQALVLLQDELLGPVQRFSFENDASDEDLPPGHWFWDEAVSGGIFVEHGVHFFDAAHLLLGSTPHARLGSDRTPARRHHRPGQRHRRAPRWRTGDPHPRLHPRRPVRAADAAPRPRRRRGPRRGLDPAAGPRRGVDRRRRRRDGVRPAGSSRRPAARAGAPPRRRAAG